MGEVLISSPDEEVAGRANLTWWNDIGRWAAHIAVTQIGVHHPVLWRDFGVS